MRILDRKVGLACSALSAASGFGADSPRHTPTPHSVMVMRSLPLDSPTRRSLIRCTSSTGPLKSPRIECLRQAAATANPVPLRARQVEQAKISPPRSCHHPPIHDVRDVGNAGSQNCSVVQACRQPVVRGAFGLAPCHASSFKFGYAPEISPPAVRYSLIRALPDCTSTSTADASTSWQSSSFAIRYHQRKAHPSLARRGAVFQRSCDSEVARNGEPGGTRRLYAFHREIGRAALKAGVMPVT